MSRQFSEAARKASLDARRARAETLATEFGKPAVFVVRSGADLYGWEIRQYGGVVLGRSAGGFLSADLARKAGEATLSLPKASIEPAHPELCRTDDRLGSAEVSPDGGE